MTAGIFNPEVAWDLCNAYHLTREGAHVMCDDVVSHPHGVSDAYVSPDPTACFVIFASERENPVTRCSSSGSRRWSQPNPRTRKFVALMRKTAQDGRLLRAVGESAPASSARMTS